MNLLEAVKKLNNDELVYIGSRSAFFFIGYPDEFISRCDAISREVFSELEDRKTNATNKLRWHMNAKPEEGKDKVIKTPNPFGKDKEEVIPYETLKKSWDKRKEVLDNTLAQVNKSIERYVPLRDRKIKEQYRRIEDAKRPQEKGTIIIIHGYEVGRLWFYDDRFKKHIEEDE